MSSFDKLSFIEQQRIKMEETSMKKRVVEDKKRKEQEAKEKEERLKQLQQAKIAKSTASAAQQQSILPNSKNNQIYKSALPPTGLSSKVQRPSSAIKPNEKQSSQQAKQAGIINKIGGPTSNLKKVISMEDISEQRTQNEIEQEDESYNAKPKEVKNAYHNIPVKGYQKQQADPKEQYLIQLQVQEQMKKIQQNQQQKQQQAKKQNMLAKQQVIEEMLNQAQQISPYQSSKGAQEVNIPQAKYNNLKKENKPSDEEEVEEEYEEIDIENEDKKQDTDDLNDTLDYNQNKSEDEDIIDQQNNKYQKQGSQKQVQSLSKISSHQEMYADDSLNQLPPVQAFNQKSSLQVKNNISKKYEQGSQGQMIQSQNYVGEGEFIENNKESMIKSKNNNQSLKETQRLSSQQQSVLKKSNANTQESEKINTSLKGNVSKPFSLLHNERRSQISNQNNLKNESSKTEYENVSVKGQRSTNKVDASSRVSELNKGVRDKIFQDEIEYTESIQIDSSIPFFNQEKSANQKSSVLKKKVESSGVSKYNQDQAFQRSQTADQNDFTQSQNIRRSMNTSNPCVQQEDSDRSNRTLGEQKNSSQFSKNQSKISSDSQNFNKNLSHTSSGSQRFIRQSAQNERFPIFNKGSQVRLNQDDSDRDMRNKSSSSQNLSERSSKQPSNNLVSDREQEVFQEESDENNERALPVADKKFQTFKAQPIKLQGSYYNEEEDVDIQQAVEDEEIENQKSDNNQFSDDQEEDKLEQTEFEEIGNQSIPQQQNKSQRMKQSNLESNKSNQYPKRISENQSIQNMSRKLNNQYEQKERESDEDKEELQDEASLSTKLHGSKQQEEEPMIVSFGAQNQQNQISFGKKNSFDSSKRTKSGSFKYEDTTLDENFQTFGARDGNKFLGLSNPVQEKKDNQSEQQSKKSSFTSKDFNETQRIPQCDATAQFHDEGNPFKQLKQQMRQVKQKQQNSQLSEQDIYKKQEFEKKREEILKDAEVNIKKAMNDKIVKADSNKFLFDEQNDNESYLDKNKSTTSGISQNKSTTSAFSNNNKSSSTRQDLINNMRKKKDDQYEQQPFNQREQLKQDSSSYYNKSQQSNNVSTYQKNPSINKINDQSLSNHSENENYEKRSSFDLKFQEAYEQYDQSCNSQMIEDTPIQFVNNFPQTQQKYDNTSQQQSQVAKKDNFQKEKKGWNIPQKSEQTNDLQKKQDDKKRKLWGANKDSSFNQNQNDQSGLQENDLSQSIGQTSNMYQNQSNYQSKLQRLHESEEFQDNEFIEPTLKFKMEEETSFKNNRNTFQPKIWDTRNINAGNGNYKSKGGAPQGYTSNGNQMELERDEDERDYANQGYSNYGYGNQGYGYSQNQNRNNDRNYQNENYDNDDQEDYNNYNGDDQDDQDENDYDEGEDQNNEEEEEYDDNYDENNGQEDNNQPDDLYYYNKYYNNQGQQQQQGKREYSNQNKSNQGKDNSYDNKSNNYNNEDDDDYNENNNEGDQYDKDEEEQIKSEKQSNKNKTEEDHDDSSNNNIADNKDEEEVEVEDLEEQKQVQKGVAMTIDFGDKDDDELEKKKRAFEIKRLKKIQELEQQKQKKLQDMQLKQQQQQNNEEQPPGYSAQKEKKMAHQRVPSQQMQQQKQKGQEILPKSESNTPSNRIVKKTNDNQNQYQKNQQNIFSGADQKNSNQPNQFITKPKSPNVIQGKEKVKLPAIGKKKENVEEENKSDIQECFTPKPSVLETPSTKPRIPFQKPSNKQLISQALTKVCLAGPTSTKERDTALKKIKDSPSEHFIVLFKGINGRQDFKALYSLDNFEVKKVYGLNTAPTQIDLAQVQSFYRYDSGSKEFKEILVKTFSSQVDAVLLKK